MRRERLQIPEDHGHLTFSQREGKAPLPEPMKLKHLSRKFRVRITRLITDQIQRESLTDRTYWATDNLSNMNVILAEYLCEQREVFDAPESHCPVEDKRLVIGWCEEDSYDSVLTLIEFILQHSKCPKNLRADLLAAFDRPPLVAYYVSKLNGRLTITPRPDVESGLATQQALSIVENEGSNGAREHLRKAANNINEAKYADSVRDSIHAMEAVARTIDLDAGTLGQALRKLEKKGFLEHGAIKQAFEKLYGYTSDENGIRHSMIEEEAPNVGLDEAVFMFNACAAGAAYLIKKHIS